MLIASVLSISFKRQGGGGGGGRGGEEERLKTSQVNQL